jgi:hypothetical protein
MKESVYIDKEAPFAIGTHWTFYYENGLFIEKEEDIEIPLKKEWEALIRNQPRRIFIIGKN